MPGYSPYTDRDLYGPSGRPDPSDIAQGMLGDCYYLAPLGSLARQQPQVIQNAIHYAPSNQTFIVQFYWEGPDHRSYPVTVTVTQSDLRWDRNVNGVDSPHFWHKQTPPPMWAEVMEAGYAKFRAEYPAQASGPVHAATSTEVELRNMGKSGQTSAALYALTGRHDVTQAAADWSDPRQAYAHLHEALRQGRPVLLNTYAMQEIPKPNDGLVKGDWNKKDPAKSSGHSYMVEGVYWDQRSGHVMLTMRNPWGNNRNPSQGVYSDSPTVTVDLQQIIHNGHLANIEVGPPAAASPSLSVPVPGHNPAAPAQPDRPPTRSLTGDPYMDKLLNSLDDPVAFRQAMRDVANSPQGQADRTEGRALYAEQENAQLRQQLVQQQDVLQQVLQQTLQQQAQQGPSLSL